MVFKLVNIQTLLEDEIEYTRTKDFEASIKNRIKLRKSKTQMFLSRNVKPVKKKSDGRLLGTKGCLRSRKLKPMKFFKNSLCMANVGQQKNITDIIKKTEIKVLEDFSRTLAKPAGVLGECLSVSGRIASNYTPLSRYLHVDFEKKQIRYFKLDDNEDNKENKLNIEVAYNFNKIDLNIINNCGLNCNLYPTREEVDELHKLQIKNKELLKNKNVKSVKDDSNMIFLNEYERNKLDILKMKSLNHKNMLKKYRDIIRSKISQKVIFPISNQFLEDIFTRVEINLKKVDEKHIESEVNKLVEEIKNDYNWSIKKAILDYILKDKKQQLRLGIQLINFGNLREWGEKDVYCAANLNERKKIEQLSQMSNVRKSVLVHSEVKDVLKNRFSIINDGKMRKSTFSMLNRKNQSRNSQDNFPLNNPSSSRVSNGFRQSGFNNLKKAFEKNDQNFRINYPKEKKNKAESSQSKSTKSVFKSSKMKVFNAVNRENFRGKIDKLNKKLIIFRPSMKEIKTIRTYFKYNFDIRDKIISNPKFNLNYTHINALLVVPDEGFALSWDEFIKTNLTRLNDFKTFVIPSWMQEISNVYQNSVLGILSSSVNSLGKVSKPTAIKFFDNVAGLLSIDMREIVLECLKKLLSFLQNFDRLIFSPEEAIRNIQNNIPIMPKSFFKISLELLSKSINTSKE
jgi:hypothetical protein